MGFRFRLYSKADLIYIYSILGLSLYLCNPQDFNSRLSLNPSAYLSAKALSTGSEGLKDFTMALEDAVNVNQFVSFRALHIWYQIRQFCHKHKIIEERILRINIE